jgi:hypothetical protein
MQSGGKCSATRKNGDPCSAPPLTDGRCFAHSDTTAAARNAARRKGGANSARAVRLQALLPARLTPVYARLEAALTEVADGEMEPKVGQAVAAIARAMVATLQAGEIEDRLRRIEQERGHAS